MSWTDFLVLTSRQPYSLHVGGGDLLESDYVTLENDELSASIVDKLAVLLDSSCTSLLLFSGFSLKDLAFGVHFGFHTEKEIVLHKFAEAKESVFNILDIIELTS